MSDRRLPDWIKAYLDFSQHSEAPDKFHFWTAASVVAGALRRRVWIDQGYFQWTPNMYVVFVAPPGIVSKSTTASIGMNLLKQIGDIKFGPDAVTWQALAQALAMSTEEIPIPNHEGVDEYHPMSAITIVSSEFGTFLNPNDREMVDVLVSLWDGQKGAWRKATKTMGDDVIVNPWVNIIACTTPAWIAGNFPEYMIGGGFTSRCLFIYGQQKRQLIAYPGQHIRPADFKQMEQDLVHDLEIISQLKGEYKLTPEALQFGERWYEKHFESKPKHLNDNQFAGYLARKQTHIHKLAIILAASRSDQLFITPEVLAAADAMVTSLEFDMPKVFQQVGANDSGRHTGIILDILRQHQTISKADLYRMFVGKLAANDIDVALQSLVVAGMLRAKQTRNTIVFTLVEDQEEQNAEASAGTYN